MSLFITGLFAGYFGFLLAFLAFRVALFRVSTKVLTGIPDARQDPAGKHKAFEGVVRAHANATEFVPIFLIMLGLMEHLQVLSPRPLLALASLYALVRTLHSAQMAHPSVLPMIVRGPLGFLPGVIILAGMGALLVLHCVPMVAAML